MVLIQMILIVLYHFHIRFNLRLTKCLIDELFKICKKWNSFHNDVKALNLISLKMPIRHS